jgi:hypothetical protein
MNPRGLALMLVFASTATLAATAPLSDASPPPVPVLVELFTSEGCSSCPSAEAELSRLAIEQPVSSARIVPLAFHVDYWDRLGWTDPFSSAVWTARQGDYARGRSGQLYTPEAVVQGGRDCVGSDDHALQGMVHAAAAGSNVRIEVTRVAGSGPDSLRVTVHIGALSDEQATLLVALTESGLSVPVPRGENGGRTLAHAPLARDLRNLGHVGAAGGTFDATLSVPSGSRRENLDVVAFVQAGPGGRVLGVGTLKP